MSGFHTTFGSLWGKGRGGTLVATTTDPVSGKVSHDSSVPKDLGKWSKYRAEIEAAEKLGDAFMVAAPGKIISKDDFKAWSKAWMEQHTEAGKVETTPAVYGAEQVCRVKRHTAQRYTDILPSTAVDRDVKGKLPYFRLGTLDRSGVVPIVGDIVNTFLRTGDVKEAWLTGAQTTVKVQEDIQNGTRSPAYCACGLAIQTTSKHHCPRLGMFGPFTSRSTSVAGRHPAESACSPCDHRWPPRRILFPFLS